MAIIPDLEMRVDRFFTDTRIWYCNAIDCRFNELKDNTKQSASCNLRTISIVDNGQCECFERRKDTE